MNLSFCYLLDKKAVIKTSEEDSGIRVTDTYLKVINSYDIMPIDYLEEQCLMLKFVAHKYNINPSLIYPISKKDYMRNSVENNTETIRII
jgi:hypothetical protein